MYFYNLPFTRRIVDYLLGESFSSNVVSFTILLEGTVKTDASRPVVTLRHAEWNFRHALPRHVTLTSYERVMRRIHERADR